MPYIEATRRHAFNEEVDKLVEGLVESYGDFLPGDLNYCLSRITWKLWKKNPRYATGNRLVGVLECVKQEFYRRMLGPYEDEKWAQNGDVLGVRIG